jgi:uncharacterized membrane protein
MVSWDLTIDPMMSTINGNWVWHDGGSYFGVPVSNFLGWYLTVDARRSRNHREIPRH